MAICVLISRHHFNCLASVHSATIDRLITIFFKTHLHDNALRSESVHFSRLKLSSTHTILEEDSQFVVCSVLQQISTLPRTDSQLALVSGSLKKHQMMHNKSMPMKYSSVPYDITAFCSILPAQKRPVLDPQSNAVGFNCAK